MSEHTELLALILPPQGRLVVAAADSAGRLPGPGLVLALEHKSAAGSQTVAGLLDRERAGLLRDALALWLVSTEPPVDDGWDPPATTSPAHVMRQRPDGAVEVVEDGTVAEWLASGAEQLPLEGL